MIVAIFAALLALGEVICRWHDKRNSSYRSTILWEGDYYVHASNSYSEASEWLACYPQGTKGIIESVFHGKATIEGARHA